MVSGVAVDQGRGMKRRDALLTRDQFREAVFARDGRCCVICGAGAVDAHHILERKLWVDGGYYLDNGASVCEGCHLRAESTEVSCEELRGRCGIDRVLLPDHLAADVRKNHVTTDDHWLHKAVVANKLQVIAP